MQDWYDYSVPYNFHTLGYLVGCMNTQLSMVKFLWHCVTNERLQYCMRSIEIALITLADLHLL